MPKEKKYHLKKELKKNYRAQIPPGIVSEFISCGLVDSKLATDGYI